MLAGVSGPRAILFDFDGTIVDTEPLHLEAFRRVLGPFDIDITDADYEARYLAGTDRECLERMLADYGREDLRPRFEALLAEKIDVFARSVTADPPLFPGVRELLTAARAAGPLALVTGSVGDVVRRQLAAAGLDGTFTVLVSAEDVGRGKPDPEPYRLAIGRLRADVLPDLEPGACLAIEDTPSGIESARGAGLRTLAIANSRPPEALAAADRVARSWADVRWDDLRALFGRR